MTCLIIKHAQNLNLFNKQKALKGIFGGTSPEPSSGATTKQYDSCVRWVPSMPTIWADGSIYLLALLTICGCGVHIWDLKHADMQPGEPQHG